MVGGKPSIFSCSWLWNCNLLLKTGSFVPWHDWGVMCFLKVALIQSYEVTFSLRLQEMGLICWIQMDEVFVWLVFVDESCLSLWCSATIIGDSWQTGTYTPKGPAEMEIQPIPKPLLVIRCYKHLLSSHHCRPPMASSHPLWTGSAAWFQVHAEAGLYHGTSSTPWWWGLSEAREWVLVCWLIGSTTAKKNTSNLTDMFCARYIRALYPK